MKRFKYPLLREEFDKGLINEFNRIYDTDLRIIEIIEDDIGWVLLEGNVENWMILEFGIYNGIKTKEYRAKGPKNIDGFEFYE